MRRCLPITLAIALTGCTAASHAAVAPPTAAHHTPPAPAQRPARYGRPPQFVMISFDGSGDVAL